MKELILLVRNAFHFSHTEAKGFIVVMLLMAFFCVSPFLFQNLTETRYKALPGDKLLMDSIAQVIDRTEHIAYNEKIAKEMPAISSRKLFRFNPNSVSREELIILDFKENVIRSLLKYREKGGKFYLKKDLARIYGLSGQKFNSIKKYIDLPDTTLFGKNLMKDRKYVAEISDINTADTNALKQLNGIGSKLAIRIIKFRNALGGFTSSRQFEEIYGLDSFALGEITKYFFISPQFTPAKIDLNKITADSLAVHPYVGKRNAAIIINFRTQHGPFNTFEDLQKMKGVPLEKLEKLKSYLEY